jgi:hypothetical protein
MSPIKTSFKEDSRPSMQFYVKDWLGDPGLHACSLAARGLWIDMICIMFSACHRGELTINGKPVESKMLAKIIGRPEVEITPLLAELRENRIYSVLPDGTIFCRRMRHEAALSRTRAEAGQKGAASRWQTEGKTAHGKMAKRWQTAEEAVAVEGEELTKDVYVDTYEDSSVAPLEGPEDIQARIDELEKQLAEERKTKEP